MIGLVQGYETFGVPGGFKNPGGIVNTDHAIGWCVKDQQRPVQILDGVLHADRFQVVEKLFFDLKGSAGQIDLGFPLAFYDVFGIPQGQRNMIGIGRRRYGNDGQRSARVEGTLEAACSTAAPPREWPISIFGPS